MVETLQSLLTTVDMAPADQVDPAVLTNLKGQFAEVSAARNALTRRISEEFPGLFQPDQPGPGGPRRSARRAAPGGGAGGVPCGR